MDFQNEPLIYATTNSAKLSMMKSFLTPLGIQINGLTKALPEVDEGESSPLLNARKKALAYYQHLKAPLFSCDSGLFFDGLPDCLQPGTNVRVMNNKRLTDDEMIEYYSGLAKKFGNLTARYRNAICLILSETEIHEYDGEDLCGAKFIIADTPHPKRIPGFPIDSLSMQIDSQTYYYDLPVKQRGSSMDKGFQDFFIRALGA